MSIGIYRRKPDTIWDVVMAGYFDGSDEMADIFALKKNLDNTWLFGEDTVVRRGDFIARPMYGPHGLGLKIYHGGVVSDKGFMERYEQILGDKSE